MKLEVLQRLHIRRASGDLHFKAGAVADFPDEDAIWLILKAPGAVRPVPLPQNKMCEMSGTFPESPLSLGWKVAFRDRRNLLHDGIVSRCQWTGMGWTILLNGTTIPLRSVTSVGKTDAAGMVLAAWTVREHGFDGREGGHEDPTPTKNYIAVLDAPHQSCMTTCTNMSATHVFNARQPSGSDGSTKDDDTNR